jgi:nucleoside-diphosphate-sugar epimerase
VDVLVIGGTGPSGPHIVGGLLRRGHTVVILHRGTHESPAIPDSVEHIHTDVRSADAVGAALAGRTFDVGVLTYGRTRDLVGALRPTVERVVTVGGFPVYRGYWDASGLTPRGMAVPTREDSPQVTSELDGVKAARVAATEAAVFAAFPNATHLRYPILYGPGQPVPREWCIVRRILDRRPFIVLPDGGLTLDTYAYVENAAHAVLLAVDQPERASGRTYNVADDTCLSLRQVVEVVSGALGYEWEIVEMPRELAVPARPLTMGPRTTHRLASNEAIRTELGYRDVVAPVEAVARTARWYAAHPCPPGGVEEMVLQDPFDYDAEDRLVARWRRAITDCLDAARFTREPGFTLAFDPPRRA